MSTPAPPSAAATTTISWPGLLSGILKESLRILSSHTRHFLSLSLLFLLPFSFLLLFLPLFLSPSSSQTLLLLLSDPPPSHDHSSNPLLTTLLLMTLLLFVSLLFISSSSISISHSSLHAFFGRPVRLLPSLSALPSAFLRLLIPLLVLTLFTPLLLSSPLLLSLRFFPFLFLPFSFFSLLAFLLLLSFFSLSLPVAALEPGSSSFLPPFRRSAHLVTPIIPIPIVINFVFFPSMALILWTCGLGEIHKGSLVMVVVRTVIGLAGMMLLMLYWMVSSAVMYLYCKAVRGELAEEIADEFAWEYVFLPFDEDKVPRVVSVVRR